MTDLRQTVLDMVRRGMSFAEIQKKLHVNRIDRYFRNEFPEEAYVYGERKLRIQRQVLEHYNRGMTAKEIAEEVSKSVGYVYEILRKNGIYKRSPKSESDKECRIYMSNADIYRSYKNAMKPKEQIRILSELNLCSEEEIEEIIEKEKQKIEIQS